MIGDLLLILALCFAGFLFWQQRHQAEIAKQAIQRHCDKLDLQLLNVAFGQHKFKTPLASGVGTPFICLSFPHLATIVTKVS